MPQACRRGGHSLSTSNTSPPDGNARLIARVLSSFWAVPEPAPRLTVYPTASSSGVRPSAEETAEETASRMEGWVPGAGRPSLSRGAGRSSCPFPLFPCRSLAKSPRKAPSAVVPGPFPALVARVVSPRAVTLWLSEPAPQTSVVESLNGPLPF